MSKNAFPRGFVLLDRDGTIIVNKHYQKDPAATELLPRAREGLDALRNAGFGLVMITNQSGVARGLLSEEDVAAVNRSVIDRLGGDPRYFAGVYHCPHVDEDGCDCRKPRAGMVEKAAADLGFSSRERCYVVGDREADIELGKKVGAAAILVRTGTGAETEAEGRAAPDYVAEDLLDAAGWILRRADRSG